MIYNGAFWFLFLFGLALLICGTLVCLWARTVDDKASSIILLVSGTGTVIASFFIANAAGDQSDRIAQREKSFTNQHPNVEVVEFDHYRNEVRFREKSGRSCIGKWEEDKLTGDLELTNKLCEVD